MNINNFERHISSTVLDRGYAYYTDEKIIDSYKNEDN